MVSAFIQNGVNFEQWNHPDGTVACRWDGITNSSLSRFSSQPRMQDDEFEEFEDEDDEFDDDELDDDELDDDDDDDLEDDDLDDEEFDDVPLEEEF